MRGGGEESGKGMEKEGKKGRNERVVGWGRGLARWCGVSRAPDLCK